MTTLVLLPGMDGTGTLFGPLIKALPNTLPFKVVAYPPDVPAGYDALRDFAEAALPVDDQVILLGESFSGPIAISLAAKHPNRIKGVILCCTFARSPRPSLSALEFLVAMAPIKQLPIVFASAALLGRHATPELRTALRGALAMVPAAVIRERLKAVMSVDVSADLAKVSAPILYLRATEDRLVPKHASDIIKRLQPSTNIVEIVGPHCLLQAAPVICAEAIQEFMH